ncbi:MAG: NADH-quinone oxidoreductase subunit C [Lentisphaeria bacterium]|nr:NADH-quinone oxidoreductase subunit C [Lentisphaeria bacterium]
MSESYLLLKNGERSSWSSVPVLGEAKFHAQVIRSLNEDNCRVESFFAVPEKSGFFLVAVLGDRENGGFRVMRSLVEKSFASLTPEYPGLNRFEREIFELHGIIPEGHPNLKPLRFPAGKIGEMDFFAMEGKAVHEVAVGPVHAGVIEPGHFRFECMGEMVYSLEISLGYQHRGVEKMLIGAPDKKSIHLIETAAGDSSIAAAWNYCRIIEALSDLPVSPEALDLRQIALELERCANHIGDLGALAGDVAFLPTASFCGRIRGEYLNMSAELCGNRFGRNFLVPGGCRYPLSGEKAQKIAAWIRRVSAELWNALELMFNSPTVLDRLENTGCVSRGEALMLGLTGVAARACAVDVDSRRDFPGSAQSVPAALEVKNFTGDVLSRAAVRYAELKNSHEYLLAQLDKVAASGLAFETEKKEMTLAPDSIVISVTEAWRGELCHTALTDGEGKFRMVKITDPSFHNWEGLAMALRDEEISHFPICNKSFNLSYCGHDL